MFSILLNLTKLSLLIFTLDINNFYLSTLGSDRVVGNLWKIIGTKFLLKSRLETHLIYKYSYRNCCSEICLVYKQPKILDFLFSFFLNYTAPSHIVCGQLFFNLILCSMVSNYLKMEWVFFKFFWIWTKFSNWNYLKNP